MPTIASFAQTFHDLWMLTLIAYHRQHLQKLKKKDSGSAGTGHVTSGGKVGKASTPKKAATPMKRGARKGKQADVDLLTDDSESPLESKASCKVKKEHRMKEEPDSDDDKK